MVYLARYILFVVERRVYVLQLSLQFDDLCFIAGYVLGDGGLQRSAARTQLVIGKLLYERINRLDLFYIRLDFLAVLLAFFVPKNNFSIPVTIPIIFVANLFVIKS